MKKVCYFCLVLIFLSSNCNLGSSKDDSKLIAHLVVPDNQKSELDSIQFKIYNSFVKCIIDNSVNQLNSDFTRLTDLYRENPNNVILYWKGYLLYYKAICYLRMNDRPNSEKTINEGIDILKSMEKKNSEDYALLALLQGLSIQFASGMKAGVISGEVKKNLERALELDSTNLRANYVFASNDYYTPAKYGGKKKVEKYLLKAISLPDQKVKNTYLPSWGREESYSMLVRLYIEKESWDSAKKYYKEGMEVFPESYSINQYASKLIGK